MSWPFSSQKLNSIKDPNVRAKTVKFLNENIEVNLHDIGFHKDFLSITPKPHATTKIHQLDFIQIKLFCTSKDTINKMQTQSTEWKKILKLIIFSSFSQ